MSAEDAWQAALRAEHRAWYAYGLLGPWLRAPAEREQAAEFEAAHDELREKTAAAMRAARLVPAPPAANYPDLTFVNSPGAAHTAALQVEEDTATAWRRVITEIDADREDAPTGTLRTEAIAALTAAAIRAVKWRLLLTPDRPTVPFPGISASGR